MLLLLLLFLNAHRQFNFTRILLQNLLLPDSKFTQQELPACKPILTPRAVILPDIIYAIQGHINSLSANSAYI